MAMDENTSQAKGPVTIDSLSSELTSLGISSGDVVLVHASLGSLGWVNGGPMAVIQALLRAVGHDGTIVMPTQSSGITNPENWRAPPVPAAWVNIIRDTMPAYDPRITPTQDMGRVAELFRTWPGAVRSDHPSTSFAALGPLATQITRGQSLSDPLGMDSPLGQLYRLGAKILLIGVDFDTCTALHLAERIAWPDGQTVLEGAPLIVDGTRQWVSFEMPRLMDGEAFLPIGATALRTAMAAVGPLGDGQGILVGMRQLVDLAVSTWAAHRNPAAVMVPATSRERDGA